MLAPRIFNPKTKSEILEELNGFHPELYAETRNFTNGHLSFLSPYISRGVISTREIAEHLLSKLWSKQSLLKYIQELAWRDYFQLIYALNPPTEPETGKYIQLPTRIVRADTGITGIDSGIKALCDTGYIHNHQRMYVAMLMGNILKLNPVQASKWFYYHLLDADIASNTLNWEWIVTKKKYYANQENINRFCHTDQHGTFLDVGYEALPGVSVQNEFLDMEELELSTELPETDPDINFQAENIFIYDSYHLDDTWFQHLPGTRILLLEPLQFDKNPISTKCLRFIIAQAKRIPEIKVYCGSFSSLKNHIHQSKIYFKEHPLHRHYSGIVEPRQRLFHEANDNYPSFSSYWKKCLKYL